MDAPVSRGVVESSTAVDYGGTESVHIGGQYSPEYVHADSVRKATVFTPEQIPVETAAEFS